MTQTHRQKLSIDNGRGATLAAALERPRHGTPLAYACFAHCFTCSKDIAAASRISRALCYRGFAVLRFDFTGLGNSAGDFANETFSSNVDDLVAVADFMRERYSAPALLVGHSLGGAAVLAVAPRVPEVRAVATIGAPSDPAHVRRLFVDADVARIEAQGSAQVSIGGRRFRIAKSFLDDIDAQKLERDIGALAGRALCVMHAPGDKIVGIHHARRIFEAAKHPKSFVSLDDADHLLSNRGDSEYVAGLLGAWAGRYVGAPSTDAVKRRSADATLSASPPNDLRDGEVWVERRGGGMAQTAVARAHRLAADEPTTVPGGSDSGMTPYELLLAGLGACTSMTLTMYAQRKGWPLERVSVRLAHKRVHATDCERCETESGRIDWFDKRIHIVGDLDDEQRARLAQIADRCPVHRTMTSENVFDSTLVVEPEAP